MGRHRTWRTAIARVAAIAYVAAIAGCGRLDFDALGGTADGPPAGDAVHGDTAPGDGAPGDGSTGDSLAGALAQQAYVKASNTNGPDQFGTGVALSADGSTLAVGAFGESSDATGVDGNQADNSTNFAGAVYVFTRAGTAWSQQAYVKASNPGPSYYFGTSVALSTDGSTLAVGSPGESSNATGIDGNQANTSAAASGAVYVFARTGTTWSQQAYVKASNHSGIENQFGTRLALSADGSTLAVGSLGESSAATGIDGNQADSSASGAGAVYVFTRAGTTWSQQAYVKASNTGSDDYFGGSVALSADGSALAVGAYGESSRATGVDGNQTDNSAALAGAVYVFARTGATWSQQHYLKASNAEANDYFGWQVELSADGTTLAASAYGEASSATGVNGNQADDSASRAGAAYVFAVSGATWVQQAYVKASNTGSNDQFGWSTSLAGDGALLAVGARYETSDATGIDGNQADTSAAQAGAIYLYARAGTTWTQAHYVKASNTDGGDAFGDSCALSPDGATLAVGASQEASDATGIDGNQADNSMSQSGAVYVFR